MKPACAIMDWKQGKATHIEPIIRAHLGDEIATQIQLEVDCLTGVGLASKCALRQLPQLLQYAAIRNQYDDLKCSLLFFRTCRSFEWL